VTTRDRSSKNLATHTRDYLPNVTTVTTSYHTNLTNLSSYDTKLLKNIKDNQDATDLQTDLNNLQNWCECNDLFLNIDKCKLMCFNLIKNQIIFNYSISN